MSKKETTEAETTGTATTESAPATSLLVKYRVNRNTGWPIEDTKYPHGAVFESADEDDAKAVEQGYLTLAT